VTCYRPPAGGEPLLTGLKPTVLIARKSSHVPEGSITGGSRNRLTACHVLGVLYGFGVPKGDGTRRDVRGSRLLSNGLAILYDKEKPALGLATVWSGSPPGGGQWHIAKTCHPFEDEDDDEYEKRWGDRPTQNKSTNVGYNDGGPAITRFPFQRPSSARKSLMTPPEACTTAKAPRQSHELICGSTYPISRPAAT